MGAALIAQLIKAQASKTSAVLIGVQILTGGMSSFQAALQSSSELFR